MNNNTQKIKRNKSKIVTIDYLTSLGSFLDEKGILWSNDVRPTGTGFTDTISFETFNSTHAFELAVEYKNWLQEIIDREEC